VKLEARAIGHALGGRVLLRDVSFGAPPGTITVVVGANGSGKTTLLRILVGAIRPDAGEVTVDGAPLATLAPRARARRIAYLPQSTPLSEPLRVRELVALGRTPWRGRLGPPAPEDSRAVEAALARVEAQSLADRTTDTLSGGERQRIMLARMLATGADVLVLDEPTTSLDLRHALVFLDLCRRLTEDGTALVLALHDVERANGVADQAISLGHPEGAACVGAPATVLDPERLAALLGLAVDAGPGTRLVLPRVDRR
jgi:iron complex transport system ATP-binding protein